MAEFTRYPTPDEASPCGLCATGDLARQNNGLGVWAECSRYSLPLVVLKRHSGSPTAGEWRDLEVAAKARFPEYRWRRPIDDNSHFYFHAVDTRGECNIDHTIVD